MTKKPTLLDLLAEVQKEEKVETVEDPVDVIVEEPEPVVEENLDTELKHTESGLPYHLHLSKDWHKCESMKEFYQLKEGEVVFDKDTVEPIPDQEYALYSPSIKRYYIRRAMPGGTNYKKLREFLKDGNLYIK